ncbi:hypothetical protein Val02_49520 [Virgisporangium aliadipatigenens]|uniref:Uncharacterized protein n=1 Tax=Virgisporangium aliadipatigenens TaxID=741659 RepID=A0A8J3YQK2_9ACTN|nr:hypothetical protein [Virgisporangium aliadipatigenens]GIJ48066.1 hypothetical protein Val02_49520 [Virgisporangium aliadipatigenens]
MLRRTGLLRLVSAGGRSRRADEYQLVIPVDLLDRDDLEVLSPAAHDLAIEITRTELRGRPAATTDPRLAREAADTQTPRRPDISTRDFSDAGPVDAAAGTAQALPVLVCRPRRCLPPPTDLPPL